ncbi:hypothetical protein [Nonlabens sp.]|uniref:hypothetical protein n=1 Tax=Nonlabens sp. TaxID=1888209 RepID=UPI003F69A79D
MGNIKLSDEVLQQIKSHYTSEYEKTLQHLAALKKVLYELKDVEIEVVAPQDGAATSILSSKKSLVKNQSTVGFKSTKAKVKKSKSNRGRKSKWGDFIIRQLKAKQKPLSYDDLANYAIVKFKLEHTAFDNVRKKIVGAVFYMKKNNSPIDSYAKKGSRTKYLGLQNWFEREGKLLPEFKNKI